MLLKGAVTLGHLNNTPEGFQNRGISKQRFNSENCRIKCFSSKQSQRDLKTDQSLITLYLCLRKTRAGKSRDYRDVIVFDKLRLQNVFRPNRNEKSELFRF